VIGLYLQVFAVLALVAGAASALGNEVRLWIDQRHEDREAERAGRHRRATALAYPLLEDVLRGFRRQVTRSLFAEADEAIASEADTVWLVRG
jgi:hypothetical protein